MRKGSVGKNSVWNTNKETVTGGTISILGAIVRAGSMCCRHCLVVQHPFFPSDDVEQGSTSPVGAHASHLAPTLTFEPSIGHEEIVIGTPIEPAVTARSVAMSISRRSMTCKSNPMMSNDQPLSLPWLPRDTNLVSRVPYRLDDFRAGDLRLVIFDCRRPDRHLQSCHRMPLDRPPYTGNASATMHSVYHKRLGSHDFVELLRKGVITSVMTLTVD